MFKFLYELENFRDGILTVVNTTRLHLCQDGKLHVTEELIDHIAHEEQELGVEQLDEFRYNETQKCYEAHVVWK